MTFLAHALERLQGANWSERPAGRDMSLVRSGWALLMRTDGRLALRALQPAQNKTHSRRALLMMLRAAAALIHLRRNNPHIPAAITYDNQHLLFLWAGIEPRAFISLCALLLDAVADAQLPKVRIACASLVTDPIKLQPINITDTLRRFIIIFSSHSRMKQWNLHIIDKWTPLFADGDASSSLSLMAFSSSQRARGCTKRLIASFLVYNQIVRPNILFLKIYLFRK